MQMLGLHVNALTGEIPDFSSMKGLRALYLDSNALSSTIPSSLGGIGSSLVDLRLGSNDLKGTLPSELGKLSSLRDLHVQRNDVTGSLPLSFAGMKNLHEFHAYDNRISGSIPIQVGFLGFFAELKVLYLDGNEVSYIDANLCLCEQDCASVSLKSKREYFHSICISCLLVLLAYCHITHTDYWNNSTNNIPYEVSR